MLHHMSTHERIQSERAGLGADGQQVLYRVERHSSGLKGESMAESLEKRTKNHVSYSALTKSCRIHVYVVQCVIYMVRCDVQRWNMQKQIDATRYIVLYKTDDRVSIIVLRYARHRMRIVSQGRLTL